MALSNTGKIASTFIAAMAMVSTIFAQDSNSALAALAAEVGDKPAEAAAEKAEVAAPAPEEQKVETAKAEEVAPAAAETKAEAEVKEEPVAEVAVKEEEKAEEEPVAEAKPAAANAKADDALIDDIMTTERMRIAADKAQMLEYRELANQAMIKKDYAEALRYFELEEKANVPAKFLKTYKAEIVSGKATALYLLARQAFDVSDFNKARDLAKKALDLDHPRAGSLIEKINSREQAQEAIAHDYADIKHRRNDKDYQKNRELIRKRLRDAAQYLSVAELDKAEEKVGLVLRLDPYNTEAIDLRQRIERRRKVILEKERQSTREGMIADIGKAWRPVYSIDSNELPSVDTATSKTPIGGDPQRTIEQTIEKRMQEMILPSISLRPPATLADAVDYFRQASKDFDKPELPVDQRGFNFVLDVGKPVTSAGGETAAEEGFGASNTEETDKAASDIPQVTNINASNISLWEALKYVCRVTGFKFKVQGNMVVVMPKNKTTDELITRSYNVLESFLDRVNGAASDVQDAGNTFGSNNNSNKDEGEDNQEEKWKNFFGTMGVQWPSDSRIIYIKTIGKLRVTNTAENLSTLEEALSELNVTPTLIEIETRFVEVAQEDLNSLGFEWLLNSDYSLATGGALGKVLGIKGGTWGSTSSSSSGGSSSEIGVNPSAGDATGTSTSSSGGTWTRNTASSKRNIGISSVNGTDYQNGMRYLSTSGNPISGEGSSTNDQFMRVNAFLGSADLSMILHMLSQRSDTDLLSAPKVVTRAGQEATMKVVTEYIYPTDYDVQLQSSSSSGSGSSSGGSQSAILAVVEPQNFTMREVGVILQVTPDVSPEGSMITLELHPRVVDEPTWKNYGMKLPYSGNTSSGTLPDIGSIFTSMADALNTLGLGSLSSDEQQTVRDTIVSTAMDSAAAVATSASSTMTYYDAPMEQPFFSQRSVDTNISIYNGATVVMGGLITEQRKTMDDKIPFLGDIPYIGRLFRSRSEWSSKRNLLIFVTARLVDPRGRQISASKGDDASAADKKPVASAPKAE